MISVPGKVLFFGGYSVLLKGHISLSIAVFDEKGEGVNAHYKVGERRLTSPQFNIDVEPSLNKENPYLIEYAYVLAEKYLEKKGKLKNKVGIKVENSPIFGDVNEKSGLGSSAASTVAVVKAMFLANELSINAHIETIHKISQMAYAFYANKIGSGFDIATSAYSQSIIYYRYNPNEIVIDKSNIEKALALTVDKPWAWLDVKPVNVPAGLLIFNIKNAKTSTISSVKAWKKWKAEKPDEFVKLMEEQNRVENIAIKALLNRDYEEVRKYTHKAREVHRTMQEEIKKVVEEFDPIEPEPLKEIIDEVEKIEGIIAGRCPGAGGWDSIAFLTKPDANIDINEILDIGKDKGIELHYLNAVMR